MQLLKNHAYKISCCFFFEENLSVIVSNTLCWKKKKMKSEIRSLLFEREKKSSHFLKIKL